ncbi:ABC transporter substrate-binding protein [Paenibacillus sp. MY03]|jgi:putative aldouronate transport system substrate-binding protein|uniref:extracellular solute-binding protein n=1 Tax=Paenibacillus sp. MY03 TaxID=302980 RepID=UPI000B3C3242|nr:extracellular solute-binding protein [Paenibacillus sp. MY03]OUS69472.1 ABC transporter substrate-binding protein [Paenibacillus sp. MY03]
MLRGTKKIGMASLSLLLAALLAAGCSGGKETGKETEKKPVDGQSQTTEVGYPDKLSYFVYLDPNVSATLKDLSQVGVYRKLEEITKTKVEFMHPSSDDQFNLMMTSGNMTDVVEANWGKVVPGADNYIKEKRIIRLNELIEKHAPNFSKLLKERPDIKKMITSEEGNIYAFPFIRGDDYLLTAQGLFLRKDWLDKLNLKVPTTIDEWETVLRAFKEKDPNGNGKADEIPFLLELSGINNSHAFVGAWGVTAKGFYQEDGVVKYGAVQPQFLEFIKKMSQWYKEGLIDKDFATTDGKLKDSKVTGNQLGAMIGFSGSGIGKYMGLMQDIDKSFDLVAASYPVLKAGDRPELGQKDFVYNGMATAITTSNKNPEATVKWLDYAYGPEGHMLFNFGIEGESYNMVDGYPTYTDLIMKNPDGLPLSHAMGRYIRAYSTGPFVQDRRYMEQYAQLPQQKQAIELWMQPENKKLMPIVMLTPDESSKFSSIMNDVNTFYDEKVTKYIMGAESLDTFNDFIKTLKGMGIDEATKIQQAALDRYNSGK